MLNKLPTFLLVSHLNWTDVIDEIEQYSEELQSRLPDTTQLYFGEPDDYPVFVPIQLFDNEGYEIIEPIAYNGDEPIW